MTPFIGQLKLSPGTFFGLQPFRTDCIVAAPPLVLFDPCAVSLEFMRPCYVYFGGARKRGTRGGRLKIEEIVSNAKNGPRRKIARPTSPLPTRDPTSRFGDETTAIHFLRRSSREDK